MKPRTIAWIGAGTACALWLGRAGSSGAPASSPAIVQEAENGAVAVRRVKRRSSCELAPNGTPCDNAATGKICVSNVCLRNECGDGLVAGAEECDDTNVRDGDGCSAHCTWEPLTQCPNGAVDDDEECDDGNSVDGDECTNRCTIARCGDGALGPGEECDDGNIDDTDDCTAECRPPVSDQAQVALARNEGGGGCARAYDASESAPESESQADNTRSPSTSAASSPPTTAGGASAANSGTTGASRAGSTGQPGARGASGSSAGGAGGAGATSASDPGRGTPQDRKPGLGEQGGCHACRKKNCREFAGGDVYGGCFERVNPAFGANENDASFLSQCQAVVACAQSTGCHRVEGRDESACYCGSHYLEDCQTQGPADDAACRAQWEAATRSTNVQEVVLRFTDPAYPSGWAAALLQCDRQSCFKECVEGS